MFHISNPNIFINIIILLIKIYIKKSTSRRLILNEVWLPGINNSLSKVSQKLVNPLKRSFYIYKPNFSPHPTPIPSESEYI